MILRAVVFLEDEVSYAEHLKRLVLFFDEILFVPPTMHVLPTSVVDDGTHFVKREDGSYEPRDFNYFRDTRARIQLPPETLDAELRDALQLLIERNIAREVASYGAEDANTLERATTALIAQDAADAEFNAISGTTDADYNLGKMIHGSPYQLVADTGELIEEFLPLLEPDALRHSRVINTTLSYADRAQAFPVFIGRHFQAELRNKYERLHAQRQAVGALYPQLPSAMDDAHVAETVFNVVTALFASGTVRHISLQDALIYREEMSQARRMFVTGDLLELAALTASEPWSVNTRREVDLFVKGRLHHNLAKFDSMALATWEKLFGALAMQLSKVVGAAGVGGGIGGLAGTVLPNTSTSEMFLLGALAAIGRQVPEVAQALVEQLISLRERNRTGIAYIAGLR